MTDYHDIDGNPITLPKLCRTEPEWAANRIRDLSAERDTAEANLERLQNKFEQVTGENGRLSAEGSRKDAVIEAARDVIRYCINDGDCIHVGKVRAIALEQSIMKLDSGIHHPDHESENSMCACPSCIDEGWKQQAAVDGRGCKKSQSGKVSGD